MDNDSNDGKDRISGLPESILVLILSFLPMPDAIRTGVLSKAFANKWTVSPRLVFRQHDEGKNTEDFIRLVDRTFQKHDKTCKINKFDVNMDYFYKKEGVKLDDHIELWLRFATGQGAEELHLSFDNTRFEEEASDSGHIDGEDRDIDTYILPQFLFGHSSMKKLTTRFCEMVPHGQISWTRLRTLSIGYAYLSGDIISKILRGSPVLESLELHYCEGLTLVDIWSKSVQKLRLVGLWDSDTYKGTLSISGPNLRSLEILGKECGRRIQLGDVSSVVDAKLEIEMLLNDLNRDNFDMKCRIFEKLCQVEGLTLGTCWILTLSTLELKGQSSPTSNLRYLKLDTAGNIISCLPGIARLLKNSPHIEKLRINMDSQGKIKEIEVDPTILDHSRIMSYCALQKNSTFQGLLQHLEFVDIDGFSMSGEDIIFSLLEFVLNHAKVLKRMVINAAAEVTEKEAPEIMLKLLRLPRASPTAKVVFMPKP